MLQSSIQYSRSTEIKLQRDLKQERALKGADLVEPQWEILKRTPLQRLKFK